ncbi:phage holin family protein [Paenibacillus aurantius]|uniref:Phage holin family protein n=1 Tax=Paenibacillus aurantius TaxID=2918900 RepID=A0AA96LBW4_9BACL|nr:phage holin family protein [Paenibacillus aurantius]WJH34992.1 phage holin family protein [Paenibacillus sp. CC-CFT747]WNQ10249.1 phage holin family protein [Paenibacillus aurantius]
MHILGHIVRFIVSALVLLVTGWLVPGFRVGGFGSALLLALVIAVLGWILEGIFGRRITPFGRGIIGFLSSAFIIWLSQFIVGGVRATLIGAILAALVIGIIDLFIPVSGIGRRNGEGEEHART